MNDTFSSPDDVISYLLTVVRDLFGMRTSFYAHTTDNRFHIVQAVNSDEAMVTAGMETALSESYCQFVAQSGDFMVIEDAKRDPRVANLAVTDAVGIRSYVGAPIMLQDGSVLGTLCAIDKKPWAFEADDIERLVMLARVIGYIVEQDKKIRDLSAASTCT